MERMFIAAFTDIDRADRALGELSSHGYDAKNVSVITKESRLRPAKAQSAAERTASGLMGGAVTGGAIGGLAGLLAGAGVFPALAGFLIGGPVAVALGLTGIAAVAASGAVTGAVAGGLIGALTKLGLSPADAEYYNEVVNGEGILLIVPFEHGGKAEARLILEANQAEKIQELEMAPVVAV
jgi:hypothetical protein